MAPWIVENVTWGIDSEGGLNPSVLDEGEVLAISFAMPWSSTRGDLFLPEVASQGNPPLSEGVTPPITRGSTRKGFQRGSVLFQEGASFLKVGKN